MAEKLTACKDCAWGIPPKQLGAWTSMADRSAPCCALRPIHIWNAWEGRKEHLGYASCSDINKDGHCADFKEKANHGPSS